MTQYFKVTKGNCSVDILLVLYKFLSNNDINKFK